LFLIGASDINPVKLMFKEQEIKLKKGKKTLPWREKIYLYPAILQRKWIEYKFKERFIPSVKFDTVLPCELSYNLLNSISSNVELKLRSVDKSYRELLVGLDCKGKDRKIVGKITRLAPRNEKTFHINCKTPGIYRIFLQMEQTIWFKAHIIFLTDTAYRKIVEKEGTAEEHILNQNNENLLPQSIYCRNCNSEVFPLKPGSIQGYLYKNYIPFKDYVDIKNLGIDYVTEYIRSISHPARYKKGLIHLLNMIRLASIEDELTIIKNLFKDDPQFAYFVTEKLFLFSMIPLMEDRDLQKILNLVDDRLIALSLEGETGILVKKIFKNLSRRRVEIVQEERRIKNPAECEKAKQTINQLIKSFFEQRSGRLLKIPFKEEAMYRIEKDIPSSGLNIRFHSGDFISWNGFDYCLLKVNPGNEQCLPYDVETCYHQVFTVTGISESSVYFKSNMGLRYVLFHVYYWASGLEDNIFLENIPGNMVIPLKYLSGGMVYTIGAIDTKGIPHEQVLRLKVK